AGTKDLNPTGGSWLTKVTNDPSQGWKPIENSWRSQSAAPTQISGYQSSKDGMVYIAADSFDRSQGVSMYRVDPEHVNDRKDWQPWTGNGWGQPGQEAASLTPQGARFGELSFREVDGKSVLSGFNAHQGGTTGAVEVQVANSPTEIFSNGIPTVVAPGGGWNHHHPVPGTYPQNYGGYILPGSTLDDMAFWSVSGTPKLAPAPWTTAPAGSAHQRVPYYHRGAESSEISVSRPQFTYAVRCAECGYPSVVHHRSGDLSRRKYRFQLFPIACWLTQHRQRRRSEPRFDLCCRLSPGARWTIDLRMCADRKEFVQAWPGNRPSRFALRECLDPLGGGVVELGVAPVCIDQDVGVDGDHAG
ncbi:DUF4185 domain-containing protein, partial [Mycobacterium sp.]|uniref:DUF4185 domain-containing protein n=1 Tax=Mycobacterium sp. TaxID=1785 RepID=UPI0031E114F9